MFFKLERIQPLSFSIDDTIDRNIAIQLQEEVNLLVPDRQETSRYNNNLYPDRNSKKIAQWYTRTNGIQPYIRFRVTSLEDLVQAISTIRCFFTSMATSDEVSTMYYFKT